MASPFEILGVDPDADEADIVDAYRERVKETHPDQGGSAEAFQAVQDAYERIENGYEPGDEPRHPPTGPAPGPTATEADPEPDPDPPEPEGVEVQYLNYEIIADEGWALDDDDLFEKAADGGFDPEDYGRFHVAENESLLEAAESEGYAWPFACRGGACTNCAVAVVEGEMPSPQSHILPQELHDKGIRLSCIVAPETDAKIVYNVKHIPEVHDLLLPASRFEQASSSTD
ncbi:2Fe-2S iron-sulfur cluster binding domain-containing protein [Halomicroarcula sp. F13]|uniref:2Fe-2S iron-sulfur cluster binding domain-containing protein n=1 Tax=Haloarcula rubra TaxID=2487747 RepID=A0AAW4PNW3_9EURY|nr:ferredoxin Fer [Halomicroarcula rubra]MBX0322235.1 2Fe-2S iron-sulfur cluster binding domain-containing protein [Halomicroarcula rubra]